MLTNMIFSLTKAHLYVVNRTANGSGISGILGSQFRLESLVNRGGVTQGVFDQRSVMCTSRFDIIREAVWGGEKTLSGVRSATVAC